MGSSRPIECITPSQLRTEYDQKEQQIDRDCSKLRWPQMPKVVEKMGARQYEHIGRIGKGQAERCGIGDERAAEEERQRIATALGDRAVYDRRKDDRGRVIGKQKCEHRSAEKEQNKKPSPRPPCAL